MSIKVVFQENLMIQLQKSGLSQKDLALKIGLAPQALNKYVRGLRSPGIETLEKIAAGLEISPELLISKKDDFSSKATRQINTKLPKNKSEKLFDLVEKLGGWEWLYRFLQEESDIVKKNSAEHIVLARGWNSPLEPENSSANRNESL